MPRRGATRVHQSVGCCGAAVLRCCGAAVLRCCVTMDGMHRSERVPLLAQLAELVGKYLDELNSQVQQFS
ncbi:MAG: hypothetical protein WCJ73_08245 [Actinomycetes bacterium]